MEGGSGEEGQDYHAAFAEFFADIDAPALSSLEAGIGEAPLLPRRRKQPDSPTPQLSEDSPGRAGHETTPSALSARSFSAVADDSGADQPPAAKEPKAARERKRRGELKSKFDELAGLLDPRAPKSDKGSIVSEATRQLRELRREIATARNEKERLEAAHDALRRENDSLRRSAGLNACSSAHVPPQQQHLVAPQQSPSAALSLPQAQQQNLSVALNSVGFHPPSMQDSASRAMQTEQDPPPEEGSQAQLANLAQQVCAAGLDKPDALANILVAQQRGEGAPDVQTPKQHGQQAQGRAHGEEMAPLPERANKDNVAMGGADGTGSVEDTKWASDEALQAVPCESTFASLQQVMQSQLWTDPAEDARRRPPAA